MLITIGPFGRIQLQNKVVAYVAWRSKHRNLVIMIIMAPMIKLICIDMWKDIIHVIFKGFEDWMVVLEGNVVFDPLAATWL